MAKFKKKGDKNVYDFSDEDCIGRLCFRPGPFSHYNKSISGANSFTNVSHECINRAYHGCNKENNPVSADIKKLNKKNGWKEKISWFRKHKN
jgi:hypothetical protein